jgi:hypothetical protein
MHVYILWHVRVAGENGGDAKLIGAYREEAGAQAAIARLLPLPGFRDNPYGFQISLCELDRDHWEDGFISAEAALANKYGRHPRA